MKINHLYILAILITVLRSVYDLAVKFVSVPFMWALFFTLIYGWIIITFIDLAEKIKIKSKKRILYTLCVSWGVMLMANWVGVLFADNSNEFARIVNNYILDALNALVLGIGLFIAWKGQLYLIRF